MSSVIVNQSNATINVGSNANYTISGDDDIVQIGAESVVSATGTALTLEVAGPGDTITIGGDGQFAPDGSDDVVLFQAAGTLDVLAYSRVDANASNVTATLAGDDTFGIYGANDTITANGANDAIWIGQNGTGASGVDVVNGLFLASVFELEGSNVSIGGRRSTATLSGDDVLSATGLGLTIAASGAGNVVNVAGGQAGDANVVKFADGGVVNANNVQFLQVFGDHVTLRGAANVFQSELIGAADRAVLLGAYNNFQVGGNGQTGALDVVVATSQSTQPLIEVVASSNVRVVASGAKVYANGDDMVVVVGQNNFLTDPIGGNTFILDGQNNISGTNLFDTAQLSTGDTVRMRANTKLSADVTGTSTLPDAATIVMGANDYLSVGPDIKVRVPVAVGHASLQFGLFDTVVLLAPFANAADLLAHTTDTAQGSIIQFDATGDQLQINVSKAQVASYITQGVIKFA